MNFMSSVHALVATTTTTSKTTSGSGSSLFLIVLVLVFGALYFFMIRPNQRRRMQTMRQNRAYGVGDEVVAGGMIGRVVRIGEGEVDVDTGDGVFTFVAQAVQSRAAFAAGASRGAAQPRPASGSLPASMAGGAAGNGMAGDEGDEEDGDDEDDDQEDDDDYVEDEHTGGPSDAGDGRP